jgi:hypothetical protein
MPKAILEFNLPDEQMDFELANNATKYYVVLSNIDTFLRNKIKYANDSISNDYINALQTIREELWDQLDQNNINLD